MDKLPPIAPADRLVAGPRAVRQGPAWLARAWSGGIARVVGRVDARLAAGTLRLTLPDGTRRTLGGRQPGFTADVTLASTRALLRLATGGSVGWYRAWAAGEWSSPDPVALFALFSANAGSLRDVARAGGPWRWLLRLAHRRRRNTRAGAAANIHAHYDLGNDFYAAWLGPTMLYSSGLFAAAPADPSVAGQFHDALDMAQSTKVGAIADRLALTRRARVLEIGCGWGTLAAYLADAHDARVLAIGLSDAQLDYARERWGDERVEFRRQDYRDVRGRFDAIVSVEMVEALGREHWPAFMDGLARNLAPGGRAVLQFITIAEPLFAAYARGADFIQTYVFPGGMLIREAEFRALAAARGLAWTDATAFGDDYAETLRLWRVAFDRAVQEDRLPARLDRRFVDLWRYYLMYCEGGFRGGGVDVMQVTLVKREGDNSAP